MLIRRADTCPDPGNLKPCQVYTAAAGDSLSSIATEFEVTVDELIAVNTDTGLTASSGALRAAAATEWGHRHVTALLGSPINHSSLLIPSTIQMLSAVLAPNQPVKIYPYYKSCPEGGIPATPPTNQNTNCRAYIVEKGDTLASIAALVRCGEVCLGRCPNCFACWATSSRSANQLILWSCLQFGVSTSALITVNPQLADPSLLTPGFEVLLPPYPNTCTTSIVVTSSAAVTPTGNVSSSSISYQSPAPSPSPTKAPEAAKKAPAPAPTVAKAPAHAPSKAPASAPAKAPTTAAAKAPAPTASGKTTAASTTSAAPGMVPSVAAVLALLGAAIALL